MDSQQMQVIINEETISQDDIEEDMETLRIECIETSDIEDDEAENGNEDEEEREPAQMQQQIQTVEKPPISTHVIDVTTGEPVTGLQISLYKFIDERWTYINKGITNSSGMFSQFVDELNFTPGRYRLHYNVDDYFEARKQKYPFIEVEFESSLHTETYHILMLPSVYEYTAYQGS